MKVAELVSALEELGTIYRHSKKAEPRACISQVIELLKGKERFSLAELKAAVPEKKIASGKTKTSRTPTVFVQEEHLNCLLGAQSESEFDAAMNALRKAKPKKEKLLGLLATYTGIAPRKSLKVEELYERLARAFKAEQRHEGRAQVSRSNLPI